MHHMLHIEISCPKAEGRSANNPGWISITNSLCGHNGPLPETDQGSKYVLVAVDYFTRWVEAYAISNQEAMTVARKLVDEMFC